MKAKYVFVLLAVFFVLGFISALQIQNKLSSRSPSSPEPIGIRSQKYEYQGKVTRIIDGDTLEVDGRRIRLALVDAPEINEPGY